jgi:hypothetical protein
MDETSRAALDVLRSDGRMAWVAEQMIASFSEGIAHSAKESADPAQREFGDVVSLSARDRTKREKYETSRPYTESEKLVLIRFALEEVFVTLPSMQDASVKALADLGSSASTIEFTAPDEEERSTGSYSRKLSNDPDAILVLRERLAVFCEKLVA